MDEPMDRPSSVSDYSLELHEQAAERVLTLRTDISSALMEWRVLATEENHALRTGAHVRAGRFSALKEHAATRLFSNGSRTAGCSPGGVGHLLVMPIQCCPACAEETSRHLHRTSKIAAVNHYKCGTCGHIWTIHKEPPFKGDPRHAVARDEATGVAGRVMMDNVPEDRKLGRRI